MRRLIINGAHRIPAEGAPSTNPYNKSPRYEKKQIGRRTLY